MSDADRRRREGERILAEYARREREVDPGRHRPWNPAERLMRAERGRLAAALLHRRGVFPRRGDRCLEIGYGELGWLAELLSWGLAEADLAGVELSPERAARAQEAFPGADLRVGDAAAGTAWQDGSFRLVILSTVLTSVLDPAVRQALATEARRLLAPDGAVVVYDFRRDNPRNPNVRRLTRGEISDLFAPLAGDVRSLTLAPPLLRVTAPLSPTLASLLSAMPFLRTHLLAVLRSPASG